ncbi:MerR family transcriptional regulator [Bacterioplanoides pacificum]|uniref:MerR family transcriptional regulator n=1 Tax=Bacterioplanoides pacificum TaxID=1171596 RepID=A0ABV7VPT6_9GAMM
MASSTPDNQAAYYPIRVVSSETGVNAITLRAWERRYGLLTPKRTAKGHRLYSEADIHLIKQVVSLLNRGIPISQAQAMLDRNTDPASQVLKPSVSDQTSQWQHYRETLHQALRDFDERALSDTFEDVAQFFPIDIALRFLLIPIYRQLKDAAQEELGQARLRFYAAFLQARLAVRLYQYEEQPLGETQPSVAIVNFSHQDEVSLLLMAVLLKQLGMRPVYFNGLMTPAQTAELMIRQQWQAAVVQVPRTLEGGQLEQLQSLAVESGKPVFVSNQSAADNEHLKRAGLIPLGDDVQQGALNIRDLLKGSGL